MKRYRVMPGDFDSRSMIFDEMFGLGASPEERERNLRNVAGTLNSIMAEAGYRNLEQKAINLRALGTAPFSLIAFHNIFFRQVRSAFLQGSYYPALTAACALGERMLNHLILKLRDDFKDTLAYRRVRQKDSFDNWELAISSLESWNVLLPDAASAFRELATARHRAIHFRPEVDQTIATSRLPQ